MANELNLETACKQILGIKQKEYRWLEREGILPPIKNGSIDILLACKMYIEYWKDNPYIPLADICDTYLPIMPRRYRDLSKEGILSPVKDGLVRLRNACHSVGKYYRDLSESGGNLSLNEEKVQLVKHQARLAKIKADQEEKTVVFAADVKKAGFNKGRNVRDAMENIPDGVADKYAAWGDAKKIRFDLRKVIKAALNRLSLGKGSEGKAVKKVVKSKAVKGLKRKSKS